MKYGKIKSGDMNTGKGPSSNKDNNKNKNLEQNMDKIGLRGSKSETNGNNNGNVIKDKTVFFNKDSPTKTDNPPDAENNQYDKFVASQAERSEERRVGKECRSRWSP